MCLLSRSIELATHSFLGNVHSGETCYVEEKYGNPPVFITKNGRSLKIVQLPADKIFALK